MAIIHLKPAKAEKLADVLYGQLLEQMASGSFKEGDRLPSEPQICEAYGVSRPTVREALGRLRADGLIVSRQGAGSFVKRQPPPELFQVAQPSDVSLYLRGMEARMVVEPETARLAAKRRNHAELHRIREAMQALIEAIDTRSHGAEQDFDFHLVIAEASGNELLHQFMILIKDQVVGQMTMTLGLTQLGTEERRTKVVSEHRAIFQAIADGEGDEAALLMRYHLHQSRARSMAMKA